MTVPVPVVQVWDATGATSLGMLAGFTELALSGVFSDVGGIRLSTPKDVAGAEYLDVDGDWQLSVHIAGADDPLWFVSDDDEAAGISDAPESEIITVTGRDLGALLDEAKVAPSGGVGTTPAEWAFADATPGKVIEDLFVAAQARGMLQGVTLSGGAATDADGDAWPSTVTATYRAGTSLLEVAAALRDAGLLEWRWAGRVLEIYGPGGGLDRDLDVALRPRRDVASAQSTRSRRQVATAVLVGGAAGVNARRTQSLTGRRAREVYVSEQDAAIGVLNAIGDLYLAAHDAAETQITHELTDTDGSPVPWADYRPGDRLLTVAAGTSVARRRVQQIAMSMTDAGAKVTLELGSILRTAEERMRRDIDRLLPGDRAVT